jgi:hypothetical protein
MKVPLEIQSAVRNPAVKKAWISEFPAMFPDACTNCGGAGIIVAFVATEGPYDHPAGPYLVKDGVRLTSKAEIINNKTRWWVGQTISLPCPECQNQIAPTSVAPDHTWAKQAKMDYMDK